MTVSAVIPTRNRPAALGRALASLAAQTVPLDEVIIVDASDTPAKESDLRILFPALAPRVLAAAPSVCAQRNLGIRAASGTHVLLCDDDVELPPDYMAVLRAHFGARPACGAASGLVVEPDTRGVYPSHMPAPRPRALLWSFVFQLTVWGDLSAFRAPLLLATLFRPVLGWYRSRGNTLTRAGWPLVTTVGRPHFSTRIYALGAACLRRDWLLDAPFDETLDAHGIGDNYGVALGLPGTQPIDVLPGLLARHTRAADNRLDRSSAHVLRIGAMRRFHRFRASYTPAMRRWLLWSIVGNILRAAARRDRTALRAAARACRMIWREK